MPPSPPVKPPVDGYLHELWTLGGTDVLLTAGAPPLLRVDGALRPVSGSVPLTPADTQQILDTLMVTRQEQLAAQQEKDFSFTWRNQARVRGNAFWQAGTVAIALRMVPRAIPTFDGLGLPAAAREFATLSQGLVLVTGPTGSGKSTTLASLIDWILRERPVHVLTVEDPVEYVHEHQRGAVNQREVGVDTPSFSAALRSALREDPDVLLVGEMRDLESIRFALTLAETGHLVFATLHTNDSAQAVDRLIDVFPPEAQTQIRVQLAATLTGVIYQRLVPRVDGGLIAAYEVLVATPAVRNLVRDGKTNQLRNVITTHQSVGMVTLEASLSALVSAGICVWEDAAALSHFPKEVERRAEESVDAVDEELDADADTARVVGRGRRRRS